MLVKINYTLEALRRGRREGYASVMVTLYNELWPIKGDSLRDADFLKDDLE